MDEKVEIKKYGPYIEQGYAVAESRFRSDLEKEGIEFDREKFTFEERRLPSDSYRMEYVFSMQQKVKEDKEINSIEKKTIRNSPSKSNNQNLTGQITLKTALNYIKASKKIEKIQENIKKFMELYKTASKEEREQYRTAFIAIVKEKINMIDSELGKLKNEAKELAEKWTNSYLHQKSEGIYKISGKQEKNQSKIKQWNELKTFCEENIKRMEEATIVYETEMLEDENEQSIIEKFEMISREKFDPNLYQLIKDPNNPKLIRIIEKQNEVQTEEKDDENKMTPYNIVLNNIEVLKQNIGLPIDTIIVMDENIREAVQTIDNYLKQITDSNERNDALRESAAVTKELSIYINELKFQAAKNGRTKEEQDILNDLDQYLLGKTLEYGSQQSSSQQKNANKEPDALEQQTSDEDVIKPKNISEIADEVLKNVHAEQAEEYKEKQEEQEEPLKISVTLDGSKLQYDVGTDVKYRHSHEISEIDDALQEVRETSAMMHDPFLRECLNNEMQFEMISMLSNEGTLEKFKDSIKYDIKGASELDRKQRKSLRKLAKMVKNQGITVEGYDEIKYKLTKDNLLVSGIIGAVKKVQKRLSAPEKVEQLPGAQPEPTRTDSEAQQQRTYDDKPKALKDLENISLSKMGEEKARMEQAKKEQAKETEHQKFSKTIQFDVEPPKQWDSKTKDDYYVQDNKPWNELIDNAYQNDDDGITH